MIRRFRRRFSSSALEQELTITHVINTHGHPDHMNGNARAVELTGAKVAAHPDSPARPDVGLADGQELTLGALRLNCLHTPGLAERTGRLQSPLPRTADHPAAEQECVALAGSLFKQVCSQGADTPWIGGIVDPAPLGYGGLAPH